jgi:hypothetical protein
MIGANGWIKVDPPYIVFKKLVNNSAIKSPKRFTLPKKKNLAKTLWVLSLDFQTVCIYARM